MDRVAMFENANAGLKQQAEKAAKRIKEKEQNGTPVKPAEEKEKARPEVRINGQMYRLRFDLWALEKVEEEFGGMRQAFEQMTGGSGGMVKALRKLFAITANCQRNLDGMPEDVTGSEISGHESMTKLLEVSAAVRAAIEAGMKSETTDGGEASDKKKNPLDEEYERKNG